MFTLGDGSACVLTLGSSCNLIVGGPCLEFRAEGVQALGAALRAVSGAPVPRPWSLRPPQTSRGQEGGQRMALRRGSCSQTGQQAAYVELWAAGRLPVSAVRVRRDVEHGEGPPGCPAS